MIRLLVLYVQPEEPAAYDKYYLEKHIPIARRMKALRKWTIGKVLGTFAMYHREPREPTVRDLALVDLVTQTAALVIDRARARTALHEIEAIAARTAPGEPN